MRMVATAIFSELFGLVFDILWSYFTRAAPFRRELSFSCGVSTGVTCGETIGEVRMGDAKLDLLQGTLDLMVLQTLASIGAVHGYGIARRIEQVSGDEVLLNQGTIYAALVRLQQ